MSLHNIILGFRASKYKFWWRHISVHSTRVLFFSLLFKFACVWVCVCKQIHILHFLLDHKLPFNFVNHVFCHREVLSFDVPNVLIFSFTPFYFYGLRRPSIPKVIKYYLFFHSLVEKNLLISLLSLMPLQEQEGNASLINSSVSFMVIGLALSTSSWKNFGFLKHFYSFIWVLNSLV